jgi:hypothetical protein
VPLPQTVRARALLLIAGAVAMVALARPAALDIGIGPGRARALVTLGFASIRIAFDSGQDCPKTDGRTLGAVAPAQRGAAGTPVAVS